MSASIERLVGFPTNFSLRIATDYYQAKNFNMAEQILEQIRQVTPNDLDAVHLHALCLASRGEYPKAIALMEEVVSQAAVRSEQKYYIAYATNLCSFYERTGRYEEARAIGEKAESLAPTDTTLLHNLGVTHFHHRRHAASAAYAAKVIELEPNNAAAHLLRSEALLAQGYYEEGWKEYGWRFNIPNATNPEPKLTVARWKGGPFSGRMIVIGDQGFGDIFMWWRYIDKLQLLSELPLAVSVPVEVQSLLKINSPEGVLGFNGESIDRLSVWTTLSDLPVAFGAGIKEYGIPNRPYLKAAPDRIAHWKSWLDAKIPAGERRIGLSWAGRAEYVNDKKRSISFHKLMPLTAIPNTTFVSLLKGPREADLENWPTDAPAKMINAGCEFSDWLDTQACIHNLDLVISVDTGIVHLTGAMGKPVWLMLPFSAEWRWGVDQPKTPWYPSATLWRQSQPEAWDVVVQRIAMQLMRGVPIT